MFFFLTHHVGEVVLIMQLEIILQPMDILRLLIDHFCNKTCRGQ